jgi:hypothetical protein
LAFGEVLGALTIDIHPSELLTVMVVDSYLPMAMLSSAILMELGRIPCFGFGHDLAPIGMLGNIASSRRSRK